ncbi:ROK family protein [Corynebacterium guaraldiae]|uniref:ROK family protein n=1 Tax=Corynebacterium guaraldiae TaxID=3051103 RepID=UPI003312FDCA
MEATGLSQPTITRATAALLKAGLIQERTDLTRSQGRGRPTVPLEASDNGWLLSGIAVGTTSTYIGLYDTRGRIIREDNVPTPVSKLSPDDFVEHVIAGVNRLTTGVDRTLVSVGVTTSGSVDEEGKVHAANLGWDGMDIAGRLDFQFGVPVTVTPAVPAILASETQAAPLGDEARTLVLFADDSSGAALSDEDGVASIELPQFDGADPRDTLVNAALAPRLAEAADAPLGPCPARLRPRPPYGPAYRCPPPRHRGHRRLRLLRRAHRAEALCLGRTRRARPRSRVRDGAAHDPQPQGDRPLHRPRRRARPAPAHAA